MSEAVTADAQFNLSRVLRPQNRFESLYQGQQAVNDTTGLLAALPIPFFEWVNGEPPDPRDPVAGEPGFSPDLLRFMKVPFGAKCKLKIPQVFFGAVPTFYRYLILHRDSNLARYAATGEGPYHNPLQRFGAPDNFNPAPTARFALPVSTATIIRHRPPGVDPLRAETSDVFREYLEVRGVEPPFFPLIGPGQFGVYQQGIVDPNDDLATGLLATFVEIEFETKGDEILIVADRECVQGEVVNCVDPLWDFAQGGIDQGFANIYGTNPFGGAAVGPEPASTPHANYPNSGIYLYTGTAP